LKIDSDIVGNSPRDVNVSESKVEVTFDDGQTYVYGRREGFVTPEDELDEFAELCRSKWYHGRKEYAGKGLPFYEANTIQEAQNELLDLANFFAVLFWELERLKEKINYQPEKRG